MEFFLDDDLEDHHDEVPLQQSYLKHQVQKRSVQNNHLGRDLGIVVVFLSKVF